MRRTKAIILGDSHVTAIAEAVKLRQESGASANGPVAFFASRLEKPKSNGRVIPGLTETQVADVLGEGAADDVLICAFGGNQYNTLGLLEHEQPFDLFDPDTRTAPQPTEARVVPLAQINAAFDQFVINLGSMVQRHAAVFRGRSFILNPPPPKGSNDYIRRNAEGYFRTDGKVRLAVSPPGMRRRLWQAQSLALRRLSDRLGVGFIDVPEAAMDEEGFLKTDAYGVDATHANAVYGEMVLTQIEGLMTTTQEVA